MIELRTPESVRILGLMSGTSCDGLDLALLRFGPAFDAWALIRSGETQFPDDLRARLLAAPSAGTGDMARLGFDFMHWCADQVAEFLGDEAVDLVVSHGQTVFHDPPRATLQIGDGNVLAARLGVPVLWNLRSADVAVGGQGAPLVPVPDRYFFQPRDGARWILNIGGIANLTGLSATQPGWAGDVGPGNCWLDRFIEHRTQGQQRMDEGGAISAAGVVDEPLLQALVEAVTSRLGHSLDRETFSWAWLQQLVPDHHGLADGARTLVALTATLIASAVARANLTADTLYVAGGGAHNQTMMDELAARLAPMKVEHAASLGMPGDCREAACFAALGWFFLKGRSGADPRVTGAQSEQKLGSLALP